MFVIASRNFRDRRPSVNFKHHILIIDDSDEMTAVLAKALNNEGHQTTKMSSATDEMARINAGEIPTDLHPAMGRPIDLVITDFQMPGLSGIEFTKQFREMNMDVPVVLLTGTATIEKAIEAIREGAYDFIAKPFKFDHLNVTIRRALAFRDLHLENVRLRDESELRTSFAKIIGKSNAMLEIFELIKRVSRAHANILIVGESGTGKEKVARAIHDEGPRRAKKFVAINCAALPDALLESELFGHAKGSFTGALNRKRGLFEEAEGGTLFLDEIGDMDPSLQAKLLRVLQDRKIRAVGDTVDRAIDVRIISATHQDLKQAIKLKQFREDLYYRLAVIPILIPSLRERKEDIPLLAEFFFKIYAHQNNSSVVGFSSAAMEKLVSTIWNGNVRELENVVERAVVLCSGKRIEVADLPNTDSVDHGTLFEVTPANDLPSLEEVEKRYIEFVLDKTHGRKDHAAKILNCNRRTLFRKEKTYAGQVLAPVTTDLNPHLHH